MAMRWLYGYIWLYPLITPTGPLPVPSLLYQQLRFEWAKWAALLNIHIVEQNPKEESSKCPGQYPDQIRFQCSASVQHLFSILMFQWTARQPGPLPAASSSRGWDLGAMGNLETVVDDGWRMVGECWIMVNNDYITMVYNGLGWLTMVISD